MNRLLLCFVCFALSYLKSFGLTFTVDNIKYTTFSENNTVKVTGFAFSLVNVVIPSTVVYNNIEYQVKSIGNKGLYGYNSSSSSRSKMESLVISEGVESIEGRGVLSNSKLKTVSLPSSLIEIGDSAFYYLSNLKSVIFPNGSNLKTIGEFAFWECGLESFDMPSSVVAIGQRAFYANKKLSSIIIPENVTVIQSNTFASCSSLTTVVLNENITRIEQAAFYQCSSLENIDNNFPESLEYIGGSAFYGVPGIKHLVLNGKIKTIEGSTFAQCKNLEYVWLQEGITTINKFAFGTCRNLRYIVLPSTLRTVKSGAFGESNEQLLDYQIHDPRTFVFLASEPFEIQYSETTDGSNNIFPSLGKIAEGDCFYVKESAVEAYKNKWKSYKTHIKYMIPFDSSRTYSTNYREFDTDFHVAIESGNKPFVATNYNNLMVVFTSIDDGIVPAETGILIRKQSDSDMWYQIAEQQGTKIIEMNNYLKGVKYSDTITPSEENGYVNYILNNGIFCTFLNAGLLGSHKAYLSLPTSSLVKQYDMQFDENQVTDITITSSDERLNDIYYDLQGNRVMHPQRGIYIVNNKKVLFK